MRKFVALFALLVSCEPFPVDNEMVVGDARDAFEYWRGLVVDGKMREVIQTMTVSYKSQWVYDLCSTGAPGTAEWRARMTGIARTDLDLWLSKGGEDTSRGRVQDLPDTVIAEPTLQPLLVSMMEREKAAIASEFRRLQVVKVSADNHGVSILVHNQAGEPEMYEMVLEGGGWKVNGHQLKARRP